MCEPLQQSKNFTKYNNEVFNENSLFQVTKVNEDFKKKIEDLQVEMKKFKAVFLKQENRIKGLESKLASLGTDPSSVPDGSDVSLALIDRLDV